MIDLLSHIINLKEAVTACCSNHHYASSWLNTEINTLKCMVSKTSKKYSVHIDTHLPKINNADVFTGQDLFGSHRSRRMFVCPLRTEYK